ncbi:type II toxin-antitoxin system Phd/YefM family antitoxin [Sphingomonas sp. MMS12-HWE2-04]|uniref:type II toxin-antitoxin system Phd/YefM family antitoxin n=1 Tax=Sphingomonas sp. MMS12-HWE2-04 TaxID=3234199 RepID=UPI00384C75C3
MEISIREAQAQFDEAIAAARRGELVIITDNGTPIAEIRAPSIAGKKGLDWEALHRFKMERGLDKIDRDLWPPEFDDPAFSREVLGLEDDWKPSPEG